MTRHAVVAMVLAVSLTLIAHAVLPRYEVRHVRGGLFVRVDRWTGHAQVDTFTSPREAWLVNGTHQKLDLGDLVQPARRPFLMMDDALRLSRTIGVLLAWFTLAIVALRWRDRRRAGRTGSAQS